MIRTSPVKGKGIPELRNNRTNAFAVNRTHSFDYITILLGSCKPWKIFVKFLLEHIPMATVEGWGKEMIREFGSTYTLLYLKRLINKVILHSTGFSAQCYMVARMGGSSGENRYMYMYH